MSHSKYLSRWVPALVLPLILCLIFPIIAFSQAAPPDTIVTKGKRTVIVIDEDGKVIVHHDENDNLDGSDVFFVDPDEIARKVRFFSSRQPEFEFFDRTKFAELAPKLDELRERFEFAPNGPMVFDFWNGEFVEERVEIDKMEKEVRTLARQARRAEAAEKAELEAEIREKLQTLFERKAALEEKEAERLQERLQEKRERLEERRRARDEIVDRRLRELLGEETIYDW